jgi:O-methyltransferase
LKPRHVITVRTIDTLARLGLDETARSVVRRMPRRLPPMRRPPWGQDVQSLVMASADPFRYATIALAVRTILAEEIPGAFAEVGVYRGELSRLLHTLAPQRDLYLFDTFEGFPSQDLDGRADTRFRDTSVDMVRARVGSPEHVVIRQGYFPETAAGLEGERFAFVMLDLDIYAPTKAGLEFFYPRLSPRGYLFLDDYNNPESGHAVARASSEFLRDKPELPIEIGDRGGTLLIRRHGDRD